jgi:hypothetical protein
MITRCYFNKSIMCARSIDRANKELIVNFVGTPDIQECYATVVIDDHAEPNKISVNYDAAEATRVFRKWKQERFEDVKLINKTEVPDGLHARFSYRQMWDM